MTGVAFLSETIVTVPPRTTNQKPTHMTEQISLGIQRLHAPGKPNATIGYQVQHTNGRTFVQLIGRPGYWVEPNPPEPKYEPVPVERLTSSRFMDLRGFRW